MERNLSKAEKEHIKKESERIYNHVKKFFDKHDGEVEGYTIDNAPTLVGMYLKVDRNFKTEYSGTIYKAFLDKEYITKKLTKDFKERDYVIECLHKLYDETSFTTRDKHWVRSRLDDKFNIKDAELTNILPQFVKEKEIEVEARKEKEREEKKRFESKAESYRTALEIAKTENDAELVELLQERVNQILKIELEEVFKSGWEFEINLLDFFNTDKEGLINILYKAKLSDLKEDKVIQEAVHVEPEETPVEAVVEVPVKEEKVAQVVKKPTKKKKNTIKRNGTKVKQVIEAALKQKPKEEWYNNGKIVKSKVYRDLAEGENFKAQNVKKAIERHYQEPFNKWAERSPIKTD
ncbi:hypothetical protein [Flagellimonas onchidii]|uniref:hypothetical protein n=1 Tax=Flagellimonas onchidii TaxID=2562684 RepID=UPI0010A65A5D|nr:hypothetical protein [Allomuricauda onchidii]